jgi:tetratricopeptide (TPR) repeat protein
LLASRAIWFYLGKLFCPVNLTFSYPKWNIEPTNPLHYTWLFLCLAVAWSMWHWRKKLQHGPIAAIAFFIVALSPMLGFFSLYTFVYTYVADHYQYVASIGPITLFVSIGCIAVNRLGKYAKGISTAGVVLILLTLGMLTWRQSCIYKDRETLWQDTIRKNPDSFMAHHNLGLEYAIRNRLDEAASQFNKVLQLNPDCAEAYNDLGMVFGYEGNLDEAERYFLLALKKKPNFAYAHYNLGSLLDRKGKRDEAIQEYMKVLEINPNFAQAEAALAAARSKEAFGGVGTEVK